jgi:hypothetical protein
MLTLLCDMNFFNKYKMMLITFNVVEEGGGVYHLPLFNLICNDSSASMKN